MRDIKRYVTVLILATLCATSTGAQDTTPDTDTPRPEAREPDPGAQASAEEAGPGLLDSEDIDLLLNRLGEEDADHERIADRITALWARSGSAAVDLLMRRGTEALEAGEPDVAVDHLTAALDHAPEVVEAWHMRAMAHYNAGRAGEALDDLARTLDLEPRHFGALAGIGFVMQELGYDEGALGAFRAAQAIHPAIEAVNHAVEDLGRAMGGETL